MLQLVDMILFKIEGSLLNVQVRPGTTATYILGTAGLLAFCSGGLASLALLAIWGVSRPRENSHQTGKARQYDEVSSEAGWSEVSTGADLP